MKRVTRFFGALAWLLVMLSAVFALTIPTGEMLAWWAYMPLVVVVAALAYLATVYFASWLWRITE